VQKALLGLALFTVWTAACRDMDDDDLDAPFEISETLKSDLDQSGCPEGSLFQQETQKEQTTLFCIDEASGFKVGPHIQKTSEISRFTVYKEGEILHHPLVYNSQGELSTELTDELIWEEKKHEWMVEWIQYNPEFLIPNEKLIYSLEHNLVQNGWAPQSKASGSSCGDTPVGMDCIGGGSFAALVESDKESTSWQKHDIETFYIDSFYTSAAEVQLCKDDCSCSQADFPYASQDLGWLEAQSYCELQGKRLPTDGELLLFYHSSPESSPAMEWALPSEGLDDASLVQERRPCIAESCTASLFKSPATSVAQKGTKLARFRCVTSSPSRDNFRQPIPIPSLDEMKMDRLRGYGKAWMALDRNYKFTVIEWKDEERRQGYLDDPYTYKDIYMLNGLVQQLQERFPKRVQLWQMARSHFGFPVIGIVVGDPDTPKRGDILHMGAIHGNEFLGINSSILAIEHLLTSEDEEVVGWLRNYNFWFIPMVNPDGNWMAMRRASDHSYGRRNGRNTDGTCDRFAYEGHDISSDFPSIFSSTANTADGMWDPTELLQETEPETYGIMHLAHSRHFIAALSLYTGGEKLSLPQLTGWHPSPSSLLINQLAADISPITEEEPTLLGPPRKKKKSSTSNYKEIDWLYHTFGTFALALDYPKEQRPRALPQKEKLNAELLDVFITFWRKIIGQPYVAGWVLDEEGAPMHAKIRVPEATYFEQHSWYTRDDGRFYFLLPQEGIYTVRVEIDGYITSEKKVSVGTNEKDSTIIMVKE
jgi:hypothetical protein